MLTNGHIGWWTGQKQKWSHGVTWRNATMPVLVPKNRLSSKIHFKKWLSGKSTGHQLGVNPHKSNPMTSRTNVLGVMGNHGHHADSQLSMSSYPAIHDPPWGADRWSVPSWWQPWVLANFGCRKAAPIASYTAGEGLGTATWVCWTGSMFISHGYGSKLGTHWMVHTRNPCCFTQLRSMKHINMFILRTSENPVKPLRID